MKIRSTIGLLYIFILCQAAGVSAQSNTPIPIGTLRGTNSYEGGGADSNFVYCKIVGIIYGNNLGTTGDRIQYTVRDATGGIGIFKNTNGLPFELVQGDSVRVIGLVNNFNGLSQVSLDSVVRLGVNRPIHSPRKVKILNEDTESDLVVLKGCSLSTASSWPASPSGSGFVAKFKRGTREFDIRIDNDCDLFNEPAPVGYVDIVGIGGQFDPSIPKNSGFQLLPRALTDITPGVAPVLDVDFEQKSLVVSENAGSIQIPISQAFSPTDTFRVQVIGADSNATQGVDYTIGQGGLVTFPANVDTTQSVTLNIINDNLIEGAEKFKLRIRKINGSTSFEIGPDSVISITIIDDEVPASVLPSYSIGILRGANSIEGGVADSLNVNCKINGTLYGPNLRGVNNGIQFVIRDITGGINIFSSTNNFGLTTLAEGDSVRAIGKIGQFNGLSQMILDSIVVLATGRPLKPATPVDSLSEATESDLVVVTDYQIVDPLQWTTGVGTGFTVQVSNGTRTLDLRIDNDCPLFNMPAPTENILSITGLGGQFDASIPRNSGYQLIARKASDLALGVAVEALEKKMDVVILPNPSSGAVQFKIGEGNKGERLDFELFNSLGTQLVKMNGRLEEISERTSDILSKSPSGFYHVRFQQRGQVFVQKLIRQ